MNTRLLLISLCCLAFSAAPARAVDEKAQAYLQQAVEEHGIPAASAGIAVDGEILWTGAAGFGNIEERTPATPETVFRIASISKVLTAVAVLQLAEKGVIDLEAPVQRYLPDYPEPRKGTIRVIHLLSHTSGIRHYKGNENRTFTHYDSLRDACQVFEARKPAFVPGTKYKYTSYGFTALGAVLESATGGTYASYMQEHVWIPAGMTHTALDDRSRKSPSIAQLYRKDGGKIAVDDQNDLSVIYPAGGLVSTAEDLLRFVIAFEDGKLVSRESMDRMLQPVRYEDDVLEEHAGLGWNIWVHDTHGNVYHRVGGQSGSSALLISYRDQGVTVALLTNLAHLDPIWEIINTLIGFGLEAGKP